MFRYFIIPIFLIALVTSTLNAEESFFKPFNNKSLKNVEINDLNNQKINIYNLLFKNKNYIINFWATWCLPCKKELPELQKIHMQLSNKNLKTYIISIDKKTIKKQLMFLKNNNIDIDTLIPIFDQKMNFYNSLKLRGIPTTIIINKKNKMAMKEGIIKYSDKIIEELNVFFN